MYDIDYQKWADYVEEIAGANSKKPSLVLDLGCGTGNFCIEMAKRGYDMIGIDLSEDMLSCAKDKSVRENLDILYLHQDMTRFELYGTVDLIVCLLDSINYITDKRALKRLFKWVKNYLNPGGLFIFDINSEYKLKNILGNNVFYEVSDDVTYIWQNTYDCNKKISTFDLTFFVQDKEQYSYKRHEEVHYERAFSIPEVKGFIKSAGMDLIHTYDSLSFRTPSPKSKKIFFVCRK